MSETATLEAPAEPAKQPYKMPQPHQDTMVRWYAFGDKSNKPRAAYVLDVFPATNRVRIFVPSEQLAPVKTVMHVSDPDVINKPNAVRTEAGGTWDFSTEHYRREEWEAKMQVVVDRLTSEVDRLIEAWEPSSRKKG